MAKGLLTTNSLTNPNGKPNYVGWILFLGTITLIVYSCIQSHLNIRQMRRQEGDQQKKIAELEHNLRKEMEKQGTTYDKMT